MRVRSRNTALKANFNLVCVFLGYQVKNLPQTITSWKLACQTSPNLWRHRSSQEAPNAPLAIDAPWFSYRWPSTMHCWCNTTRWSQTLSDSPLACCSTLAQKSPPLLPDRLCWGAFHCSWKCAREVFPPGWALKKRTDVSGAHLCPATLDVWGLLTFTRCLQHLRNSGSSVFLVCCPPT